MESVTTIGNPSAAYHQIIKVLLAASFLVCFAGLTIFAQAQLSTSDDEKTLIVNDAPEMEVYALGKSVIVKGRAKGVLALGGDVIVEGRVDEDVATIGGSIIQREKAYIGGDVIAFGGAYKPDAREPLREAGKETIMLGAFEEELRSLAQNPSQILVPSFTPAFFALRLLTVLLWFIVTLAATTIAPGAVGRAVAKLHLSTLKVVGSGLIVFLLATFFTIVSTRFLPDYFSVILGLMVLFLMLLSYVFGRVAVQVSLGKLIQKYVFPESSRSEAVAILIGVIVWTILLSIPYLLALVVLALFATGIGLVVTARSRNVWQKD